MLTAARAIIRPSWPPPSTPTTAVRGRLFVLLPHQANRPVLEEEVGRGEGESKWAKGKAGGKTADKTLTLAARYDTDVC